MRRGTPLVAAAASRRVAGSELIRQARRGRYGLYRTSTDPADVGAPLFDANELVCVGAREVRPEAGSSEASRPGAAL